MAVVGLIILTWATATWSEIWQAIASLTAYCVESYLEYRRKCTACHTEHKFMKITISNYIAIIISCLFVFIWYYVDDLYYIMLPIEGTFHISNLTYTRITVIIQAITYTLYTELTLECDWSIKYVMFICHSLVHSLKCKNNRRIKVW